MDLEWRVVKGNEDVRREQVNPLALLHILTGAPVAIVRLVSEGRRWKVRQHNADFVYRGPLDITTRVRAAV